MKVFSIRHNNKSRINYTWKLLAIGDVGYMIQYYIYYIADKNALEQNIIIDHIHFHYKSLQVT
jgi:Gpi18-like mannosyltransferase